MNTAQAIWLATVHLHWSSRAERKRYVDIVIKALNWVPVSMPVQGANSHVSSYTTVLCPVLYIMRCRDSTKPNVRYVTQCGACFRTPGWVQLTSVDVAQVFWLPEACIAVVYVRPLSKQYLYSRDFPGNLLMGIVAYPVNSWVMEIVFVWTSVIFGESLWCGYL